MKQNETIVRYHEIEQRVKSNQQLTELEEHIKQAQKDAVQFAHYNKPEAERQALAEADRLKQEYDEHPLVIAYRERLIEADDLIQYLVKKIQRAVNDRLEEEEL